MKQANEIKNEIQTQALAIWRNMGRRGTLSAGTGFGKSRLAVMECAQLAADGTINGGQKDVLLVTPTTKLRDENWPAEFENWGEQDVFKYSVKAICFASLKKEKGNKYKFVILDEIHRLTELSAKAFESGDDDEDTLVSFLSENLGAAVMGLTATVPDRKHEPEKVRIINQIAPVVFSYTLDQGVADGMIADYKIHAILCELDDVIKQIPGGTKKKPFLTTELKGYNFLEKKIKQYRGLSYRAGSIAEKSKFDSLVQITTFQRNRYVASCPSKTDLARRCMKQIITSGKRTLVFCGSIAQANELGGENVYHSESGDNAFRAFNAGEIDFLCAVNALNEGQNLYNLDQLLILQVDSNERTFVQRLGRCLRARDGHKATVYVLYAKDTVDERWLKKSMEGLDQSKITYYNGKHVPA